MRKRVDRLVLAFLLLWPLLVVWGVHLCSMIGWEVRWMQEAEACCPAEAEPPVQDSPLWTSVCCLTLALELSLPVYEPAQLQPIFACSLYALNAEAGFCVPPAVPLTEPSQGRAPPEYIGSHLRIQRVHLLL